ncbi:MAG: putative arabinose efflux permease, MFS family [Chloroflexi bacterium]|jgi:MFS family permease|nr:MAG: putative arabinose efflux permease, MFS family [Chloroflexota bacterium]
MWLLAPAIALALDLSPTQVGLLFTMKMLGAGLAYVPAGIIGDSTKRRGIFLLSTFWWVAVAYLISSLMNSFWALVLFMAIASAGAASWHPVAMGTMVQKMPRRRAFVIAVHGLGGTVSEVLAPLSVGFMLVHLDWRETLQLTVLPAVVMGLIFVRLASRVAPPERKRPSRSEFVEMLRIWSRRDGLSVLILFALYNMAVMALYSMIGLYLEEARGLSSIFTAVTFSVMIVASTIAALWFGRISDAVGRRPVILAGLVLGSASLLILSLATGTVALFVATTAAGVFLLGTRAAITATALEIVGRWETTVLGIALAVGEGVGGLGAVFAGLAGEINLSYALVFGAGMALLAGVVVLLQPSRNVASRPAISR